MGKAGRRAARLVTTYLGHLYGLCEMSMQFFTALPKFVTDVPIGSANNAIDATTPIAPASTAYSMRSWPLSFLIDSMMLERASCIHMYARTMMPLTTSDPPGE